MPGEAVPVLHILSSRQGFALSPSVALTADSALLPVEYKQTSLLQSMTGIHSRLGFFFCFSFSLVLDASGVSGEVLRVGSQLLNPLSSRSRQLTADPTALADGEDCKAA